MRVKATNESFKNDIQIPEAGGIVIAGTEFEVSESRFNVLNGNNLYGLVFVEKIEEPDPVEKVEPLKEEPKKVEKKVATKTKKPSKK